MTFPISTKTIPDEAIARFKEALGEENFSTDPAICDGYAMQAFHKTEPGCWINRPLAVTLPSSTEDVQAVVKICIQHGLRYKAHSSGWGAHGGPGYDIPAEIITEYYHTRGAVGAARESDDINPEKKSSGSQFYIVTRTIFTDDQLDKAEEKYKRKFSKKQRKLYRYANL